MPSEEPSRDDASNDPAGQLASNLARSIAEKRVPPAEVAAAADLSRNHLKLILEAERVVQIDTLVKLAGALGVEPADLLVGVRWVSDGSGGGSFKR